MNKSLSTTQAHDAMALIGRVLIALLFVPFGWNKIAGFGGTVGYIASAGLPFPQVGAVIAILIELGVGLMLLVGFKTRWAALVLAVFTVVAAFIFHAFWSAPPDQAMMQHINFFKNMAISGGLLAFAAFGAGAFSIDGRRGA
ncbi:MAG: DoxX family protein [Ramlibacter sp.]